MIYILNFFDASRRKQKLIFFFLQFSKNLPYVLCNLDLSKSYLFLFLNFVILKNNWCTNYHNCAHFEITGNDRIGSVKNYTIDEERAVMHIFLFQIPTISFLRGCGCYFFLDPFWSQFWSFFFLPPSKLRFINLR